MNLLTTLLIYIYKHIYTHTSRTSHDAVYRVQYDYTQLIN